MRKRGSYQTHFLRVRNDADGKPVLHENRVASGVETFEEVLGMGNRKTYNFTRKLLHAPVKPGSVEVLYRIPQSRRGGGPNLRCTVKDNGKNGFVSEEGDLHGGSLSFINYKTGEILLNYMRAPNSGSVVVRYRKDSGEPENALPFESVEEPALEPEHEKKQVRIPLVHEAEVAAKEVDPDELALLSLRAQIITDRGGLSE